MGQALTIFISAVLVGLISIGILAGYTNLRASKMPEQTDMVKIFVSGAIVGSFVAWLVTSGVMHGSSLMKMISDDVSSVVSDISLKGGDESVINTFDKAVAVSTTPVANEVVNSAAATTQAKGMNIPALSGMVGGFFKSMGLDSNVLQELNVGMPTF